MSLSVSLSFSSFTVQYMYLFCAYLFLIPSAILSVLIQVLAFCSILLLSIHYSPCICIFFCLFLSITPFVCFFLSYWFLFLFLSNRAVSVFMCLFFFFFSFCFLQYVFFLLLSSVPPICYFWSVLISVFIYVFLSILISVLRLFLYLS